MGAQPDSRSVGVRASGMFDYTSIQHALTAIQINSGSTALTSAADGRHYGLIVTNGGIGPSYFDGVDAVNTPVQVLGQGDGRFGTVNNSGSQGIKMTFDPSLPNAPTQLDSALDVEKITFGTSYFARLLEHHLLGFAPHAFGFHGGSHPTIDSLVQLTPGRYLGSAGLWLGLLFAAAFIAAAIRLRRYRGPL